MKHFYFCTFKWQEKSFGADQECSKRDDHSKENLELFLKSLFEAEHENKTGQILDSLLLIICKPTEENLSQNNSSINRK